LTLLEAEALHAFSADQATPPWLASTLAGQVQIWFQQASTYLNWIINIEEFNK
jgi:hypothetical protein